MVSIGDIRAWRSNELDSAFDALGARRDHFIRLDDELAAGTVTSPHVHVDHQYVAVVDDPEPAHAGAHPFAWFTADQVTELPMFEDSKLLVKMLFSGIGDLVGRRDPADVLRPFAAAGN